MARIVVDRIGCRNNTRRRLIGLASIQIAIEAGKVAAGDFQPYLVALLKTLLVDQRSIVNG